MRIGFYAPMKAPDHPVPSGDRQMARLLIAALTRAGHAVEVIATTRSFMAAPDPGRAAAIDAEAAEQVKRLAALWAEPGRRPDLVFAYHLHYKAPDLLALPLARRFALPYVTAEASYARKRDAGPWRDRQARVVEAVRAASLNLCFTPNDRAGLAELVDPARLEDCPPFIDATPFAPPAARPRGAALAAAPVELVTVAMMRSGDKLASYRFLAAALARLDAPDWRLSIIGDGPARSEVELALAALPPARLRYRGTLPAAAVAEALHRADLFVWPGFNEAFGLCYLEAGAAGLPAVAVAGEGTPSVVLDGETGLLTAPDPDRYAAAVATLLTDAPLRRAFGQAAGRFVHGERDLPQASRRLDVAVRRARGAPARGGAHG